MKLIIDIPDMIYNILNGDSSWKGLSVDYILNAVKDGTPLEAQSTEVINKIPEDYVYDTETNEFEVYRHKYTGKEIHITKEPKLYKLEAQPTYAVKCDCTTEEIAKSFIEDVEAVKDQLEAQPSEDTEVIKVSKGAVKARQGRFVIYDVEWLKEHFYATEEKIYGQPKQPCEDAVSRQAVINTIFYKSDNSCDVVLSTDLMDRIKQLPSVTPQKPKGKWILNSDYPDRLICEKCKAQFDMWHWESKQMHYCPNCGSYNGGGEDA